MTDEAQITHSSEAAAPEPAAKTVRQPKRHGARRGRPPKNAVAQRGVRTAPVATQPRSEAPAADRGLGRARKRAGINDPFHIPPEWVPPAWNYEWKAAFVTGQPNTNHMQALRENGWSPVPRKRHPELMPDDAKEDYILRDGLMLMERPQHLTNEARAEDNYLAREAVRIRESQMRDTPDGQMTRNHPTAQPRIRKGFEPVDPRAIPAD